MATISSQLRLNDGMTGVMRGISATLNTLIGGFQEMQALTGQAIDTSAFDQAQAQLDAVNRELIQMGDSAKRAGENVHDGMNRGTRSADDFMRKIVSVGAVLKGLQQASKITDFADSQIQNTARLSIMLDTGQSEARLKKDVANYQALIDQAANRALADTTNFATAVANMGNNAGDAFSGSKQIVGFTEQLQKHFALSGTSAQSAANATTQLQQGLAKGVLRGQDLNSVIEGAPTLIRAVADYMDVPVGQIKTLAEEGEITSGVIVNAMTLAADETNRKFSSMPMTFEQMGTLVKNSAAKAFRPVMSLLTEMANSDAFNQLLGGAERFFQAIADAGTWVIGNWDTISSILGVVGGVLAGYIVLLGIAKGAAIAHGIAEGIKTLAMIHASGATLGAAAAQHGLNAAMFASPITWIILAVIALIAVFIALVSHFKKSESTFGALCGGFMLGLGAVLNFGQGFGFAFMAIIRNLEIYFKASALNIQIDWHKMLLSLQEGVLKLIEVMNLVPGVNIDTSGLQSKIADKTTTIARLEAEKAGLKYEDVGAAFNSAFQEGWQDQWWGKGYDWGSGVENKVKDAVGKFELGDWQPEGWDELLDSTAETAANTSELNEDLKYMRDLAEMEVVNRFTASTVNIDMGGVSNTINSEMDVDGVVRKIAESVAEAVDSGGEGAHE